MVGAGEVGAGMDEPKAASQAFASSHEQLEQVVGFLGGEAAAGLTHAELETQLGEAGRKLLRQLYQDHLALRAHQEVRSAGVIDSAGAPRGAVEAGHTRPLVTVFGPVAVARLAYRRKGEDNLYPADGALNLPVESHSHGLRELAAIEANRDSYEAAGEAIRRYSGVHVPKRARISIRPLSEARIRRVNAALSTALQDAVQISHQLAVNPATGILRSQAGRRRHRTRPLLWTPEWVEYWERTGAVPATVMVWTATQCGGFLDFAAATAEPLYPLFHLAAYWGPRRGELVGLELPDLSLNTRRLHIQQAQTDGELDDPKSEASERQIVLDEGTARVLRAWRQHQLTCRVEWGEAYRDSGRVFTHDNGDALRPEYVSERFRILLVRYAAIRRRALSEGRSVAWIARRHRVPEEAVRIAVELALPPIRLHD
ncbi:MAG: hypothetical protein ACYDB7_02630, partial [Mycobacteriales bacterium]